MSEAPKTPAHWSVPSLVLSSVIGLLLGMAAGAAVDRLASLALGPQGAFAAGLASAALVGAVLGVVSYRGLTRRGVADPAEPSAALDRRGM
jgi:hypothetical protein